MYQALCPAVVSPVKWNCRLVWIITNKLSCLSVKPSSLHLEVFFSFRLSLEGPDLNKDQAFTYIRFIPHTRHTEGFWKEKNNNKKKPCPPPSWHLETHTPLTHFHCGWMQMFWALRYRRSLISKSSTRCAGRCATRKTSALNIWSSPTMTPSKSGASSTSCRRISTR